MTQLQHIACTRLAVAIIDARSPSEAKAIAERFWRDARVATLDEVSELADSSPDHRVTAGQVRELKRK